MYESFLFNGPCSLLFLILLLSVTTIPIYQETQQYYVTDFSRKVSQNFSEKKSLHTNSARKIGSPYGKIKPQPHSTYSKVNSKYITDLNVKGHYKIYTTHRISL